MADRRAATCRRTRGKTRRKPAGARRAPDLAANRELLDRIHRDGRIFISGTTLDGTCALRGCVTTFRSTIRGAKVCIDTIVELAERLEEDQA